MYNPLSVLPAEALARLRELAEQRHRDPLAGLPGAEEILADADDPLVEATALEVRALIQHELGDYAEAVTSFRQSISLSVSHGLLDAEASARAHLAPSLLARGDTTGAEAEIAAAWERSSVATRGIVALRDGLVQGRTGRLNEALAVFQRAQRWLEETDDQYSLALLHLYRGTVLAYQGNEAEAIDSLAMAEHISRTRDLPVLTAIATHNMGFALARLGNLPEALAVFARTRLTYAELGRTGRYVAVLEADRCEVLLLAGLVAEARDGARDAVDTLVAAGDTAHLMECRLLLARALLAGGDYAAAAAEASTAAEEFKAASRPPWAAQAGYVAVQAQVLECQESTAPSPSLLDPCVSIAAELEAASWPVEAAHVHTFAGRIALALGRPEVARAELGRAAAARTRGTADLRAQAWLADALIRLAEGDRSGAKRSLSRGMAVVDDYRASLGATELRVHAASHGADLARHRIRMALEDRRAMDVLRWAERWRAGALRRPSVRPPNDERLASDLTQLRVARSELRTVRLHSGDRDLDHILQTRIAELERSIRDRTLEASDDMVATGRVDVGAVKTALGERWLVEFIAVEGELYAVTVTCDRVRLHHLGSAQIAEEKQYLLFAIRRVMSTLAASHMLSATAARLDQALIHPLGVPDGVALVVVPTGLLHGLPWAALPSLAGRPITVAPSAAVWLGERTWRPAGHAVTVIAGPQLPGASEEVRQVAEQYLAARTLTGPDATAAAVAAALEDTDIAHLAAHGSFRADSPLFSSILLADGPLTVYELERLQRAPQTVVLASCDAAVSAVHLGDELLGTATALIGLGVRWVIAPVMRVPDYQTAPFMVALHRRMLAGDSPPAALAHARPDQNQAVAAAFICIGCNESVLSA